jgi:enoyl-CoA hydratase
MSSWKAQQLDEMAAKTVKVKTDDGVAVVTVFRPEVRNALDSSTMQQLHATMTSLSGNEAVKVVIITGEGPVFVAGADLRELREFDSKEALSYVSLGQKMLSYIEQLDRPVIAAINGHCLGGGCELALACDLRVCSSSAKIGQPGLGLGVIPGFAGTRRLTRIVGIGRAKEMVFLGEPVDARRALLIGLVNWVVEPDQVVPFSMEVAEVLKSKAPLALRAVKTLMNRENTEIMSTSGRSEIEAFGRAFQTDEPKVGIEAFFRKTKPNW